MVVMEDRVSKNICIITVKNELFGWFHLHELGNLVVDEWLQRENQLEEKFAHLNTLQQDLNNHITKNE